MGNATSSTSSSSSFTLSFRLPLYRGERDAFHPIIINDEAEDPTHNINTHGGKEGVGILDIEPANIDDRVNINDDEYLSPPPQLSRRLSREGKLVTGHDAEGPLFPEDSAETDDDDAVSPPSVVSSSSGSDSSTSASHATYGTCVTTSSAASVAASCLAGNKNSREIIPAQHSIDIGSTVTETTGEATNKQPISVLDCVKFHKIATATNYSRRHRKSSSTTSAAPPPPLRKYSPSSISLFNKCIRCDDNDDDDENKNYYSANNHTDYKNILLRHHHQQHHERSTSQCSILSSGSCSASTSSSSFLHTGFQHYFNNTVVVATSTTTVLPSRSKSNPTLFSSSSVNNGSNPHYTKSELEMPNGNDPTHESNLLTRIRNYHVVTTAALPWMTGTGVNPLLRGGYLLRRNCELKKMGMMKKKQQVEDEQKKDEEQKKEEGNEKAVVFVEEEGLFMDTNEEEEEEPILLSPTRKNNINSNDDNDGCCNAPNQVTPSDSSCSSLDYSCFSLSEEEAEEYAKSSAKNISPSGVNDNDFSLIGGEKEERGEQQQKQQEDEEKKEDDRTGEVTIVVPWLVERSDRDMLYGDHVFENMEEQEVYIRQWLVNEAGMPLEAEELKILFYPARYHKYYNSIFALGDICNLIPNDTADVCILEEPEHLNWYRAPGSSTWTTKFCHCVGVIHTNYQAYARDHAPAGFLAAPLLAGVNSLVVQANCHKVVKLSGVLQEFVPGGEVVENVHGIREVFLEEGQRRSRSHATTSTNTNEEEVSAERKGVYFIGKLLWAKGFDLLLELETYFRHKTGEYFDIDVYGSGPDEEEIKRAFSGGLGEEGSGGILYSFMGSNSSRRQRLPVNFMGRLDHSKLAGDSYSIFVNPSLTEVLCTTTAEAIAMGKWVVIPSHPSNAFFERFPNCLMYRSRRGFVTQLRTALENEPPPLSYELAKLLSWDAATMRCVSAAAISKRDAARSRRMNRAKEERPLKKALSGFFNTASSKEESSSTPMVEKRVGRSISR